MASVFRLRRRDFFGRRLRSREFANVIRALSRFDVSRDTDDETRAWNAYSRRRRRHAGAREKRVVGGGNIAVFDIGDARINGAKTFVSPTNVVDIAF